MRGRRPLHEDLNREGESPTPVAVENLPPCPEWLEEEAQAMYARLAPLMGQLGLLTEATCETFAGYCQCYGQWKNAAAIVKKEGLTYTSTTGAMRIHPAAQYASDMTKQLRLYASEFGLTPASRNRVGVKVSKEADELDSFLQE